MNKIMSKNSEKDMEKYEIKTLTWADMNFGYDQSILRNNNKITILEVTLNLNNNSDVAKAKNVAKEWATRKRIQPRVSCGSVFQAIDKETQTRLNLPSSSAGYIIDKILGLRGFQIGGMRIAPNHANFIENIGGGTSAQALEIIKMVIAKTQEKLGIKLAPEINFLGFDPAEIEGIF
jgi:UDP-N-acetylmuramate dehydrogenase